MSTNIDEISLWVYVPNKGAAIFFIAAYAATMIAHLWQAHHYNCWKLTWLLPVSGASFIGGYLLRALAAFGSHQELMVYIMSLVFIAIVPPLLALVNYHIFGRLLYYVPYLAPMPPDKVLWVFGCMSMLVEALNGIGAAIGSNPESDNAAMGDNFMRGSLALQLILNTVFLVLMGYFHWKCGKAGIAKARGIAYPLATLYASVALILARTVFRTVEHFGMEELDRLDPEGAAPVVREEWYFLVFESTLMLVVLCLWNGFHPRMYLPRETNVYLARDGVTEVSGAGIQDPRPWLYKTLDPFDLMKKNPAGHKAWQSLRGGYGDGDTPLRVRGEPAK